MNTVFNFMFNLTSKIFFEMLLLTYYRFAELIGNEFKKVKWFEYRLLIPE